MAAVDARRLDKNMWRKENSSVSAILTKEELGTTDGAIIVELPDNIYVTDCFIRVITAVTGAASINVGWGNAGNQVSNDLSLAGAVDSVASGAPSVPVHTGDTEKEVIVKPNAAMTAGEFEIIVKFTEPMITKGDRLGGPLIEKF